MDRVHQEVLDALPPRQRDAFLASLTTLADGDLSGPDGPVRPVRHPAATPNPGRAPGRRRLASRWPLPGHPRLAGCRLMFVTRQLRADKRAARGERFGAAMAAAVRHLPFGLRRVVPPRLLGLAAIGTVTFPVDLALLTAARSGLHWPLPASITVAYLLASGLGYLLNRSLNFRSHAAVGPQVARYAVVLVINYFVCILGVTTGLAALGLNYQLAHTAASLCRDGLHVRRPALGRVPATRRPRRRTASVSSSPSARPAVPG